MSAQSDRRIGSIFGYLGAALLGIGGIVRLVAGIVDLAGGRSARAFGAFEEALLLIAVALIVGFFAALGSSRATERSLGAGVVLIVLALVGWAILGFGSGVLGLLGIVMVLVAGIVFVVAGR